MDCTQVVFTGHAVRKMFQREISRDEVIGVIRDGETIAEYPDDRPFASRLLLGFSASRPIHVVVGVDDAADTCYVITAYDPDPRLWDTEFKRRRHP
jgi:hypothetical protein